MGIGSSNSKGTDPGPSWQPARIPRRKLGVDVERTIRKINFAIGLFKVQARRYPLVFQSQNRLDQARNTGCGLQMAEVSLYGTDGTEAVTVGAAAKNLRQRLNFN